MKIDLNDSGEFRKFLFDISRTNFYATHLDVTGQDPLSYVIENNLYIRMSYEEAGGNLIKRLKAEGFSKRQIIDLLLDSVKRQDYVIEVQVDSVYKKLFLILKTRLGVAFLLTFLTYVASHIYGFFIDRELEAVLTVYSPFFAFIAMALVLPVYYFMLKIIYD